MYSHLVCSIHIALTVIYEDAFGSIEVVTVKQEIVYSGIGFHHFLLSTHHDALKQLKETSMYLFHNRKSFDLYG